MNQQANQEACRGGFITHHQATNGYHGRCTEACETVRCTREGCGHPTTEKPECGEVNGVITTCLSIDCKVCRKPTTGKPEVVMSASDIVCLIDKKMAEPEVRGMGFPSSFLEAIENSIDALVSTKIHAAESSAYKQGHIDHQLQLEASTKVIADSVMEQINKKAGEPMEYTFSGQEILRKAESRAYRRALKAAWMAVDELRNKATGEAQEVLTDACGEIATLIAEADSTKE